MRLNINIAARPFLNKRPWVAAMLIMSLAAGLFTFANAHALASAARRYRSLERALGQQKRTEQAVRDAHEQAQKAAATSRHGRIVVEASMAANLVTRRGLSWTVLFDDLEDVLPRDVRILSIKPDVVANNRVLLRMECSAKSNQAKIEFERNLWTPPFDDPFVSTEEAEIEGRGWRFDIRCYYDPGRRDGKQSSSSAQEASG